MTSATTRGIAIMLVVAAGASLSADRIRLRSGKVIEGMFIGADSKTVRLLLEDGQVTEVRVEDTTAVEFSARKPAPPPTPAPAPAKTAPAPAKAAPATAAAPAAAPAPPPAPAKVMVSVPAGTVINVRLTSAIDVDVSKAGQTFKAIVDDPVMLNGSIVIPRGATATLQA